MSKAFVSLIFLLTTYFKPMFLSIVPLLEPDLLSNFQGALSPSLGSLGLSLVPMTATKSKSEMDSQTLF